MLATTRTDLHERILDETERRLNLVGYRALTMEELASGLGISKKTLYQHFPSKEALVSASMQRLHERIEEGTNALLDRDEDPVEMLREVVAFVVRTIAPLHGPHMAEVKRHLPACACEAENIQAAQAARIAGVIAQGIAEGLFRDDLDPRLATRMFLASVMALTDPEYLVAENVTFAQALETVLDILLEGIRVPVS